jgi:hypothetical protein
LPAIRRPVSENWDLRVAKWSILVGLLARISPSNKRLFGKSLGHTPWGIFVDNGTERAMMDAAAGGGGGELGVRHAPRAIAAGVFK